MFNVVSDQLKVSQGWVRCGQCTEVFDASLHLQAETAPRADLAATDAETDALAGPPAALTDSDTNLQSAYPNSLHGPDSSYIDEVAVALKTTDNLPAEELPSVAPFASVSQDSSELPSNTPDEAPVDVSFVRDARRQAFWRRPLVRVLLAFVSVLLMGLLALQLAVQQRDTLAVFEPRLKPALLPHAHRTLRRALACRPLYSVQPKL